jgi:hypothetical protein
VTRQPTPDDIHDAAIEAAYAAGYERGTAKADGGSWLLRLVLGGALVGILTAVVVSIPDIQRYLRMRQM